jgi:hypothetical protein
MKTRPAALSLVMVFLIATTATAGASGLPSAPPEQVGLSTERLGRLTRVLNTEIEAGKIPGAVALVARKQMVQQAIVD